jgi:hypothetical protein
MSIHKSDNPTTENRRGFLRATLTASAGLAAATVATRGVAAMTEEQPTERQTTADEGSRGYHVTQHIIDYYKTASF